MKRNTISVSIFLLMAMLFALLPTQVEAGPLMDDSPPPPPVSVQDTELNPSLTAGDDHTCKIDVYNNVVCYGRNDSGQATPPVGKFRQVSAGNAHTCGVQMDGTVACWGLDTSGQATPPAGTFLQVSAGDDFTCGLKSDSTVECWGVGAQGQLNYPSTTHRFDQISAGGYHACARKQNGDVMCWGRPDEGQKDIPADTKFRQVSAGWKHTCGVTSAGNVVCWGFNSDSQAEDPDGSFYQVSSGDLHNCGIRSDGLVQCWGDNTFGQSNAAEGSFMQVSAGGKHTCGFKADQNETFICWGDNTYGQTAPPTITGDTGVGSVKLTYVVNAVTKSVTSDAYGNYTISVPRDWTGTVTPSKTGITYFIPANRTYTNLNVDRVDQNYQGYVKKIFRSTGAYDGHIVETSETSNLGGSYNATLGTIYVGDDATDKQYKAILSFETSAIPDNASIKSALLKVKRAAVVGVDPFTTHSSMVADIIQGPFSGNYLLESIDFEALANRNAGVIFTNTLVSGFYQKYVITAAFPYINRSGVTQFRLRFQTDDDDDNLADYLKLYSGNATTVADRPMLVVDYYIP